MNYLSEDDAMRMQGLGHIGEVYAGADGNLYEWVDGIDAWGDSIGYWQGLSQPEVPLNGLGALYAAPDGSLYQVQGLGEEEDSAGADAPAGEEATEPEGKPAMGPGRPGQIRTGPDGKKYRWVRGRNAQGKTTGFWRRLRPLPVGPRGPQPRPGPGPRQMRGRAGAQRRRKGPGGFLKRLLPIAKVATALIPGVGPAVATGLTVAGKLLKKRQGVSGYDGLGALYQAPDGSLYEVQGFAAEELDGFAADDELQGVTANEAIEGFAADDELDGLAQDQEMQGFAETEDMQGFGQEDLQGLEQGYVRENVNGLDAYVPEKPPQTRWFVPPSSSRAPWEPPW